MSAGKRNYDLTENAAPCLKLFFLIINDDTYRREIERDLKIDDISGEVKTAPRIEMFLHLFIHRRGMARRRLKSVTSSRNFCWEIMKALNSLRD